MRGLSVVVVLCAAMASTADVRAAGTLGLDEVLDAVKSQPRLVAEIRTALAKAGVKADDVTCVGGRHGNHWTHLGGSRAAPYACLIGRRELTIDADRIYFDARGRRLGDPDKADPKRAKTFRESRFRWQWKQP